MQLCATRRTTLGATPVLIDARRNATPLLELFRKGYSKENRTDAWNLFDDHRDANWIFELYPANQRAPNDN